MRALLSSLRKTFAREALPPPPAVAPPVRRGPGLGRLLFGMETLPADPPRPPRPRGGALRLLFGIEPLARDPVPARRHRRQWLRLLFAPERLDPP